MYTNQKVLFWKIMSHQLYIFPLLLVQIPQCHEEVVSVRIELRSEFSNASKVSFLRSMSEIMESKDDPAILN